MECECDDNYEDAIVKVQHASGMSTTSDIREMTIAAVQAAPVWMNRTATVRKAAGIIREAASNGAKLVGFPEGFIPGHPSWYHFHTTSSTKARSLAVRLFEQSVDLSSGELDELCEAAADGKINVVMGLTERLPGTTGTLFNTQVLIDEIGAISAKHQKLVPTVGERLVHSPGSAATQLSFHSSVGTVSSLICGENSNPFALARIVTEYPIVHVASWPSNFASGLGNMRDQSLFVNRNVAYACACYVVCATSINSAEMIHDLARDERDATFLRDVKYVGGAAIIDPYGQIVAGPLDGDKEGLLYAVATAESCIRMRGTHDFAGHYNRPDVYHLAVNTHDQQLISFNDFNAHEKDRQPSDQVPTSGDRSHVAHHVNVPE